VPHVFLASPHGIMWSLHGVRASLCGLPSWQLGRDACTKGIWSPSPSLCGVRAFFTRTLRIAQTIPSNSELGQHLDSAD